MEEQEEIKTKLCKKCERDLPLNQFYLARDKFYSVDCKECTIIAQRERNGAKARIKKEKLQDYKSANDIKRDARKAKIAVKYLPAIDWEAAEMAKKQKENEVIANRLDIPKGGSGSNSHKQDEQGRHIMNNIVVSKEFRDLKGEEREEILSRINKDFVDQMGIDRTVHIDDVIFYVTESHGTRRVQLCYSIKMDTWADLIERSKMRQTYDRVPKGSGASADTKRPE